MKLTSKSIVEKQLAQIEMIQSHMKAIDECVSFLCADHYMAPKIDAGNLRANLYVKEVEAWRNLCMWGLTLDDSEQARIKAAAHDRVIAGKHIANWLTPDGRSPGQWFKADEDEFRRLARDAFLGSMKE